MQADGYFSHFATPFMQAQLVWSVILARCQIYESSLYIESYVYNRTIKLEWTESQWLKAISYNTITHELNFVNSGGARVISDLPSTHNYNMFSLDFLTHC